MDPRHAKRRALSATTRRPQLALARNEFGPFTKFLRKDGKFLVTMKFPKQEHITLGESEKGWKEALADAVKRRDETRKALTQPAPSVITAEQMKEAEQ